jgi:hypothetical protein
MPLVCPTNSGVEHSRSQAGREKSDLRHFQGCCERPRQQSSKVLISFDTKYFLPVNTQYNNVRMSVQTPNGTISAENADNFEDIEKQFAVKGES